MIPKYVIMTEDMKSFGYTSNPYGMVETDVPVISTFLDENVPMERHIGKIQRANQRSIAEAERRLKNAQRQLDVASSRGQALSWSLREVTNCEEALIHAKQRKWKIVELSYNVAKEVI
jgi:hypothetical protein